MVVKTDLPRNGFRMHRRSLTPRDAVRFSRPQKLGSPWAYLNTTDANYSALVANVFLAKSLGSTVTLYVNPVAHTVNWPYLVTT